MEKIKNIYWQLIRSPKLIVLSALLLFFLLLIVFTSTRFRQSRLTVPEKPEASPSAIPAPILESLIEESPFPSPSLTINWTNQEVELPDTMKVYSVSEPLLTLTNSGLISQKLGFTNNNEQETVVENLHVWQSDNSSMTINLQSNELNFTVVDIPPIIDIKNSEDTYLLATYNYLQNLFGANFTKTLIKQNINYSLQKEFESLFVSEKEANIIIITFFQTIDGYPITTLSGTGSTVTVFLNKNLSLNSLSVNKAFANLTSLGEFKTVPLSDLINNANSLALRTNASAGYDVGIEASVKNITFNQQTVRGGYYHKNNQLIPVYLLEGTVKTSVTTSQSGLYILPATK